MSKISASGLWCVRVNTVHLLCYTKWGRRLERWPNTEARLVGWRRVTKPGEIFVVMDGPCRLLCGPYRLPWSGSDQVRASRKSSCCCRFSFTKCTQNTVMSFITQGRHRLNLVWPLPSLCLHINRYTAPSTLPPFTQLSRLIAHSPIHILLVNFLYSHSPLPNSMLPREGDY